MQMTYTHITVILDRSGSMQGIRDDVIGGFNHFLAEQKAQPGKATLTLVQFDSADPYEVIHQFRPLAEVPELTAATYVPRGNKPLLDALGEGIIDVEEQLKEMAEPERPGRVLLVVVTDGQENASREHTHADVEKMIRQKTEKEGWQVIFLSADLAAVEEARRLSVPASSSMHYARSRGGSSSAWSSASSHTSDFRSARVRRIGFRNSERKSASQS